MTTADRNPPSSPNFASKAPFRGVSTEVQQALADAATVVHHAAGDVIIREGTVGDELFIIMEGSVRVASDAATERVLLARLGPGEVVGETAVLSGGVRTAAVIADSDVTLACVAREALTELLSRSPDLRGELDRVISSRRAARDGTNGPGLLLATGGRTIRIGRSPDCDVVIDDPTVAAVHAEIDVSEHGIWLRNRSPEAGTYLNRRPIEQARVEEGDQIWIGATKLFVHEGVLRRYSSDRGIRVEARGIGRTVAGGKRILRDVDLAIYPGEMVAIVGPSGAGKTTLLNLLLGLVPLAAGEVYYDSQPLEIVRDLHRKSLGYVPQDDIVHPDLTVEQSLQYAGRLRLPPDTTRAELDERITRVLTQLDLTEQRHTAVRNLSGGQRKRASIGIELQSEPRICYLDEPTSGLDPGLDEQMMLLLRRLADDGRTIVLTTHATRNIEICDRVVIVAGGLVVFVGTPSEALDHFGVDDIVHVYRVLADEPAERLLARFRSSEVSTRNVTSRLITPSESPDGRTIVRTAGDNSAREAVRQLPHLISRDLRITLADRINLLLRIAGPIVLAASLLLTFDSGIFALTKDDGGNFLNVITLLYLAAAVSLFLGSFTASNVITRESAIFRRERLVNLSPLAYVASKAGILTVFAVVQSALLTAVLALGFNLPGPGAEVLMNLFLAFALTALCGMGMGLLISALSPTPDRAAILVVLLLIPQLIFAGSTVPRSEMEPPAKLVSDATISKWSLELLGGIVDIDSAIFEQSFVEFEDGVSGFTMVISDQGPFHFAFRDALWIRWAVLGGWASAFIVATYLVQRWRGRTRWLPG